ncbi:hypothetical protein OAK17_05850, partial [Alphaproteobacteria bacterium]|nr:hypothetical protein [Alphaproteobacteria bacterium]
MKEKKDNQNLLLNNWKNFSNELKECKKYNYIPYFWLRDDDAIKFTPNLKKFSIICKKYNIPMNLAVIPKLIEDSLIEFVSNEKNIYILIHGLRHLNYANKNQKKSEFGSNRDIETMLLEIQKGLEINKETFGEKSLPVFVPPWNRVNNKILNQLINIGIIGFSGINSTSFLRQQFKSYNPLIIRNADIDIINWKSNKSFMGEELLLKSIISEIKVRIKNIHLRSEPICILSHHEIMKNESFKFIE